jgi:hypothetical protein
MLRVCPAENASPIENQSHPEHHKERSGSHLGLFGENASEMLLPDPADGLIAVVLVPC